MSLKYLFLFSFKLLIVISIHPLSRLILGHLAKMSVWTDSSEVLFTTSKALTVLDAKYLSADPQKFDVAQFTMTNDLTNINPLHKPINPTQYTTLPPIYLDEAALDAELEQHHELYTRQALPPDWYADYHFSITDTNDQSQVCF